MMTFNIVFLLVIIFFEYALIWWFCSIISKQIDEIIDWRDKYRKKEEEFNRFVRELYKRKEDHDG